MTLFVTMIVTKNPLLKNYYKHLAFKLVNNKCQKHKDGLFDFRSIYDFKVFMPIQNEHPNYTWYLII